MNISEVIIQAIVNSPGYNHSDSGYSITIEQLDEFLPETSRHLIVEAIVEMEGVEFTDSLTGAIFFPISYFK